MFEPARECLLAQRASKRHVAEEGQFAIRVPAGDGCDQFRAGGGEIEGAERLGGDHLSHAAHRLFSSAPLEATEVPHEVFFELGRRGAGGRLSREVLRPERVAHDGEISLDEVGGVQAHAHAGGVHQEECFGVVGAVGRDGGL